MPISHDEIIVPRSPGWRGGVATCLHPRPISLPELINSNDLLPNTSRSLPSCRRGDEDKTVEPAERGCAWGGPAEHFSVSEKKLKMPCRVCL
ncbi:hypothetical protein EYF80_014583 [Liparis tanakae]|uniref:Uncharacterized protein n=1 Tax=Liparis tanakae TaxID=230148 RepID=A0A4Z2IDV1_9TELE|nr:hypothetical protein EYF80_014583 [Liparis tanakae]